MIRAENCEQLPKFVKVAATVYNGCIMTAYVLWPADYYIVKLLNGSDNKIKVVNLLYV